MRATIPSLALPGDRARGDRASVDRYVPGDREGTRRPARLAIWDARRPRLAAAGALIAVAGFCALVQGPLWSSFLPLATVNLAVSLLFAFTGLMLGKEPGQRV